MAITVDNIVNEGGRAADNVVTDDDRETYRERLADMTEGYSRPLLENTELFDTLDYFLAPSSMTGNSLTYSDIQDVFDTIDEVGNNNGTVNLADFRTMDQDGVMAIKEKVVEVSDKYDTVEDLDTAVGLAGSADIDTNWERA